MFNILYDQAMAIPVLKKEYLSMVPEFQGEPELLARFIDTAEKLANRFQNPADPDDFQNEFLLNSLIAKVKGPAAEVIYNSKIESFADLKEALLQAYSDRRDHLTLELELANMKQGRTENPFKFFERISKILNLIISYISNHFTNEKQKILTEHAKEFALRVFLKGLNEPLGSLMRTKNPATLNLALSTLTNDFQFLDFKQFTPNTSTHSSHSNNTNQFKSNSQRTPHVPRTPSNQNQNQNQTSTPYYTVPRYNNTYNNTNTNTNNQPRFATPPNQSGLARNQTHTTLRPNPNNTVRPRQLQFGIEGAPSDGASASIGQLENMFSENNTTNDTPVSPNAPLSHSTGNQNPVVNQANNFLCQGQPPTYTI